MTQVGALAGNHNNLRAGVVKEMVSEILECPLDEFLNHYAPFVPSLESITRALQQYKDDDSVTAGLRCPTYPESIWLKDVGVPGKEVPTWGAYDYPPSQIDGIEMKVFEPLQHIVNFLKKVDCRERVAENSPHPPTRTCNYSYRDCPATTIKSEIPGADFKIDACITSNPDSHEVFLSETAVLAEFKKVNKLEKVADNRQKLVSAAGHVLNDDPRRTWVYGITIEDTEMSLWYFCRSHSVKSRSFNFTNNLETFIQVFLSFLYATPEEIGYDPTVHRVLHDGKICYVYEMGTQDAPRYFRTVDLLFAPRVLCITGRKTRVWKAIEVKGCEGDLLGQKIGEEVALKDGWLDEGSWMEHDIQKEIFKCLGEVKEADYQWAPESLRDRLHLVFQQRTYSDYFMPIMESRTLMKTKVRSNAARPKPSILSSIFPGSADPNDIIPGSTQGRDRSGLPSSLLPPVPDEMKSSNRSPKYRTKEQHRLIYRDVGCPLHHAKDLRTSFNAIMDTCIALTLLYLAGWTHRDVSTGNIIVLGDGESARGKLSDLEYAKKFTDSTRSADPKTGTPYFMPLEIHGSERLYNPSTDEPLGPAYDLSRVQPLVQRTVKPKVLYKPRPPPKFRFQHDLESLWWIVLWILLHRVKCPASLVLSRQVFTHHNTPSGERRKLFNNAEFALVLESVIHDELSDAVKYLDSIRKVLHSSYVEERYSGDDAMLDAATYSTIYARVWNSLTHVIGRAWQVSGLVPLDVSDGDGDEQGKDELLPQTCRPHQESKPKDDDEYIPNEDEESIANDEPGARDDDGLGTVNGIRRIVDQGEDEQPQAGDAPYTDVQMITTISLHRRLSSYHGMT